MLKTISTDLKIDIQALLLDAERVIAENPWDAHNQLCLLNTEGVESVYQGVGHPLAQGYPMTGLNESDFIYFNSKYKDGALYQLYKNFPLPVTRMRLMRVQPKRCYSMHSDGPGALRYHIALKTNPTCYFVYGDSLEMIHIPDDGKIYEMNVERPHSVVNFSQKEERIHLVLNRKIL